MKKIGYTIHNDHGSTMVVALMILALLTIVGFAVTNMSSTELNISTNSLLYERAFYTAEAGLDHAKGSLTSLFVSRNQVNMAAGNTGDWSFALDGSLAGYNAAANDPGDDLDEMVVWWLQDISLDNVIYSVRIWDNDDGDGDPTQDADGLIFVRADAGEPVRGGRCSIQELVEGGSTPGQTGGYVQEGWGSSKVYTSNDAEAISDFTQQM